MHYGGFEALGITQFDSVWSTVSLTSVAKLCTCRKKCQQLTYLALTVFKQTRQEYPLYIFLTCFTTRKRAKVKKKKLKGLFIVEIALSLSS